MTFVKPLAAAAACALAGLGVYGMHVEPYRPVLRRLKVTVPADWPAISILHISDMHVRSRAPRLHQAQERFLRSIDETPDIVCVTGDLCETYKDARRAAELVQLVQPRIGTFAILGNHEHDAPIPIRHRSRIWRVLRRLERVAWYVMGPRERSSGTAESREIATVLREVGLNVLVNEGVRITANGQSLWIAGIDSTWAGLSRAVDAVIGKQTDEPCLALVHEPEGVFSFVTRDASLILAGHTHGGQVRAPLLGALYSHRTDRRIQVSRGIQRFGRSQLHISAGLGHSIPLRLNCPPEGTWIDCVPVAAAQIEGHTALVPETV